MIANRNGRIVCFGGFEGEMPIDFSYVIRNEPVILGSNGYAAEERRSAWSTCRFWRWCYRYW
jgi:(R,R)-butanediol dehydrogenase/meso-butanediol dehydrogenase/diacetyl reductase